MIKLKKFKEKSQTIKKIVQNEKIIVREEKSR